MHTLQVNDATWDRFGGNASAMRECLALNAPRQEGDAPTATGPAEQLTLDSPETAQQPRTATPFTAGRHSWCPIDGTAIRPGDRAVMMDYHDPSTGRTRSAAFCTPCARQRGWEPPA